MSQIPGQKRSLKDAVREHKEARTAQQPTQESPAPEAKPEAKKTKPPKQPKKQEPAEDKEARRLKHEAKMAADKEAARERRSRKEAKRKKNLIEKKEPGRLPQGSTFHVVFDAETVTWSGTLTIPGYETFSSTNTAVIGILLALDQQYRAELRAKCHPVTNEVSNGGS